MKYIHVRNLEKFHPGYKDRTLQWGKIYFQMVQGDPDCELIDNEIDWGRLVKFILLELQAKKPIPINDNYLYKKGFDLKKRPISKTLQVLHNFLDIVTEDESSVTQLLTTPYIDKDKDKEKDKERVLCNDIFEYYIKTSKKNPNQYKLTDPRKDKILARLTDFGFEACKKAIDNRFASEYHISKNFVDLAQHIFRSYEYTENLINQTPKKETPHV